MENLEVLFEEKEKELLNLNSYHEKLTLEYNMKKELQEVLQKGRDLFARDQPANASNFQDDGSFGLLENNESDMKFSFLTGSIAVSERGRFERMIFRATRGNCYTRFAEIDEPVVDPQTGMDVEKVVFIIYYKGTSIETKLKKLCDAFNARRYTVPDLHDTEAIDSQMRENRVELEESITVLRKNRENCVLLCRNLAEHVESWSWSVTQEKATYHTLNMFEMDIGAGMLRAEGWVIRAALPDVELAVKRAHTNRGDSMPSLVNRLPKKLWPTPPTHFHTNKYTAPFQELVDTYGVPRYREANPGLFTTITFPFMFAVMFGDIGHGAIILLFAMWLVWNEKKLGKQKLGELGGGLYYARYMLLLMGFCATYMGLVYNDFFSMPWNLFESRFEWACEGPDGPYEASLIVCEQGKFCPCFQYDSIVGEDKTYEPLFASIEDYNLDQCVNSDAEAQTCLCYTPCEYQENSGRGLFGSNKGTPLYFDSLTVGGVQGNITANEILQQEDESYENVYDFGIDPVWLIAQNELLFVNSLKMKQAVILGVVQMSFGICLKGVNAIFFGEWLEFFFEFIPQILFNMCLFGYMCLMIFIKWNINWQTRMATTECVDWEPTEVCPEGGIFTSQQECGVPCRAFECRVGYGVDEDGGCQPPSLITTLINMALAPGAVTDPMFEGQSELQLFLVLVAVLCVPIMLLVKPIMINRQHQAHSHEHGTHIEMEGDDDGHGGDGEEEHSFSEMMIHQTIETIEFVLGMISNTASYLRLWALSLAHAELSSVFWEKTMVEIGFSSGTVGVFLMFGAWAGVTFAVIICMDSLECFLHALRLHWVEFQNKFYKADGYKFTPLAFRQLVKE
jgi:vacuolar-type H+-ATPase subunit I/STV1